MSLSAVTRLMSGTSIDAVDAVLVDLTSPAPFYCYPQPSYSDDLRDAILALCSGMLKACRARRDAYRTGRLFAQASLIAGLADVAANDVAGIGSHGRPSGTHRMETSPSPCRSRRQHHCRTHRNNHGFRLAAAIAAGGQGRLWHHCCINISLLLHAPAGQLSISAGSATSLF